MSKSEHAATLTGSLHELQPEDSSPRYRIGTRFLRDTTRWGLCEGIIDSFDGENYTVKYPSINFEEKLSPAKMADDVTITTNWDTHLLDEGQAVWAFIGKGVHPGVIMSIRRPDNRASVKWDLTTKVSDVDLDTLFPMFDYDNEGIMLTSSHSKRRRIRTNFFHLCNQEQALRASQTQKMGKSSKQTEAGTKRQDKSSAFFSTKIEYNEAEEAPLNGNNEEKTAYSKKRKPATKRPSRAQKKNKKEKSHRTFLKSSNKPNSTDIISPGPGWKPKYDVWIHPKVGLELTLAQARKFQHIREKRGGDDEAAYAEYKNILTSEQTGKRNSENEAAPFKDVGEEKDFDSTEDFEEELTMLSDYYLNKKVRKDEEIPSGMVLRAKIVRCPLLRSKSYFRRMVHKRILDLQRAGKKSEIHRLLKKLHDHDISGRSGDGPSDLLEEFLGEKMNQIHDDVEIVQPTKLNTAPEAVTAEDLTVGMSCDQTTLSSLSESLPLTASASLDDQTNFENQIVGNYDNNKSDSSLGTKDSTRLIELIDDSVDSKLPASKSCGIDDDTKLLDLVFGTVERELSASVVHDCNGNSSFGAANNRTIGNASVAVSVAAARPVKEDSSLDIIDLTGDDSSCKLPASCVSAVTKMDTPSIKIINLIEGGCNQKPIARLESIGNNRIASAGPFSSRARPADERSSAEVINLLEDD